MAFSILKASDYDTQADDTTIATLSIGAANATQAASGSRAKLKKNRLNGHSTILFDGTNDYYDFGDVFDLGTDSVSVFFVAKRGNGGIFGKTTASVADSAGQYAWAVLSGNQNYLWYKNNTNHYTDTFTHAVDTDFHLYEYHIDRTAGIIKFLRNGVLLFSKAIAPTADTSNLNTAHNFTLGTAFYSSPTNFGTFAGEIAEFQIQIGASLSSGALTAKRDELNNKYFAPPRITNLIVDANRNINSDAVTATPAVTGYQTQRRIDGGAWVTLTPTTKVFQDNENLPNVPKSYLFEYRRKAFNGVYSAEWSEIASFTLVLVPPTFVSKSPLPYAQTNKSYSTQVKVKDVIGSGNFEVIFGNLPNGAMNTSGLINIPVVGAVDYTFGVRYTSINNVTVQDTFTIPVSQYAWIQLEYVRSSFKRNPIVTATEFPVLAGLPDIAEDAPLKYEYELTCMASGQQNVRDLEKFFEDHRLKQPFFWYDADWNETRLVYLNSSFPSERRLNYGGVQVTLKDV